MFGAKHDSHLLIYFVNHPAHDAEGENAGSGRGWGARDGFLNPKRKCWECACVELAGLPGHIRRPAPTWSPWADVTWRGPGRQAQVRYGLLEAPACSAALPYLSHTGLRAALAPLLWLPHSL